MVGRMQLLRSSMILLYTLIIVIKKNKHQTSATISKNSYYTMVQVHIVVVVAAAVVVVAQTFVVEVISMPVYLVVVSIQDLLEKEIHSMANGGFIDFFPTI